MEQRKLTPFVSSNVNEVAKRDAGFWDSAGATYGYNYGPITRFGVELMEFGSDEFDQAYNWEQDISGYEQDAEFLARARNPDHMQFLKESLNINRANRDTMERGSFWGIMTASIVDPLNVAFAMPVFNVGLKAAWASKSAFGVAKEAGKVGFAMGVAQEVLRAPFDPLANPGEIGTNIISTTVGSALLVGGLRGGANFIQPRVKKGLDDLQDYAYGVGGVPNEYNGVPILKGSKGTKRPDGTKVGAVYSRSDNKIYWDEAYLKKTFVQKPWMKPKVKGVRPLPENAFNTPEDWAKFVLQHEMTHVDMPFEAMKKSNPKGYSRSDYENDVNNMALEKHYKGYALKQTSATKSWFYNAVTTPQKRILNDRSLPSEIHYNTARTFYNASLDLEGNPYGVGVQSLAARAMSYAADSYNLERDLKVLWRTDTKGFGGGGDVMGFNVDNARVKLGTYGQNARTFEEWFQNVIDLNIDSFNPAFNKSILNNLPKSQLEAIERLRKFLKDFEEDGRGAGVLGDDASIRGKMSVYNESITLREAELQTLTAQKNPTKEIERKIVVINDFLKREKTEVSYLQGLLDGSINKQYAFPIYYNKVLLKESEQAQEELTIIFKDHLLGQGKHNTWNDVNGTWTTMRVNEEKEARNIAEQIVSKIIDDPDTGNFVPRSGKGKHLMRRALDIPEWKIKNYMVRDTRVIQNYANKMGFRIEFANVHGKMDIEDILNRHEEIMSLSGKHSDARIAEVRRDFLADYEREAGIHVRNPDAWNQTALRNLKSIAGMTYLPLAGVTSIIDAVAMPIFEHGYKKVFQTGMRAVDGDFANMKLNAKQVRNGGEAMETVRPIVQYRVLTDSVRDLQPKLLERGIQSAERGFYMLNLLAPITSAGKQINTAILIPEFFKRITTIKNNGRLTKFEVGELSRYGITEPIARQLADMPWGKSDTGMPLLDLEAWPSATFQDRKLKRTMATYLAQHARNTIMHSTSGDRPMIMDGFAYIKWKPWMKTFGMSIDERASTANVKFARLENAYMSIPFQFLNFAFAANNRIFAASLDPARQHRLAGVIALMGMSYLTLKLKKDDWWFENKGIPEILMRTVDQSGITGLYSDIAYHALHTAIAGGLHNPDNSWLKGKYKPSGTDDAFDKMGAVPSMLSEWVKGAHEITTGNSMEGLRDLTYHVPLLGLSGMADDVRSFTRQ